MLFISFSVICIILRRTDGRTDSHSDYSAHLLVVQNGIKLIECTTCLKRPLKKKTKIGFQGRLLLNAGQKYCRMLQESILQYIRPSLSYHLSLIPLFCLFLSDRLRQVLLYKLSSMGGRASVWWLYHPILYGSAD